MCFKWHGGLGDGEEGPEGHRPEPGAARAPSPRHHVSPLWGVTGGLFGWKKVSLLYQEKLAGNST